MSGRPAYQLLEGRSQTARDATHWIRVYTALIKFLGQELDASTELESDADFVAALKQRQVMFQRRLDYWVRRRGGGPRADALVS
jgi:hypothetical protein